MPLSSWQLVAIVVAIAFLVVFKAPITRFIDRIKSVSKEGLHTHDGAQLAAKKPEALAEYLEGYQNPLLLDVESRIEQQLQNQGLTDPTEVRTALLKGLATNVILRSFETIEYSIFASQVSALTFLNEQPKPTARDALKTFYDKAATHFPALYEDRTLDQWFGFLRGQELVAEEGTDVTISRVGIEFLKWRVDQGSIGV